MRRLLLLLLILFGGFCSQAVADELTPAKKADIKRLMEITGSVNIGKQFAAATSEQMFRMMKSEHPEISDRAFAVMNNELVAFFSEKMSAPGGIMDQLIPVYAKYFTHREIRELLAFYDTPTGRKLILSMPKVVNESMQLGQKWGESLGPELEQRVMAALDKEGLLNKGEGAQRQ